MDTYDKINCYQSKLDELKGPAGSVMDCNGNKILFGDLFYMADTKYPFTSTHIFNGVREDGRYICRLCGYGLNAVQENVSVNKHVALDMALKYMVKWKHDSGRQIRTCKEEVLRYMDNEKIINGMLGKGEDNINKDIKRSYYGNCSKQLLLLACELCDVDFELVEDNFEFPDQSKDDIVDHINNTLNDRFQIGLDELEPLADKILKMCLHSGEEAFFGTVGGEYKPIYK